jgi:malonyl-CoA decarboxylase
MTLAQRPRWLRWPGGRRTTLRAEFETLALALLSGQGEASGVALAARLLAAYAALSENERRSFFALLSTRFGPDLEALKRALAEFEHRPDAAAAGRLHAAAEPRRQELIRRMNLAPNGTQQLVRMREQLLAAMREEPSLAAVDADFRHLFSSWFNRGFLVLRRIDWSTPAHVLEKIIRYEAVHEITSWDDLRLRLEPPDRRCFAFFHPALDGEPLIFVEVALTQVMPESIAPLLQGRGMPVAPKRATTAVFYSISNCQAGLRGVSFGNFLIKQVAEDLKRELPSLDTFVTLSPLPGFGRWLAAARHDDAGVLSVGDRAALGEFDREGWHLRPSLALREALSRAATRYLFEAKDEAGKPLDPVARFHLGNGARLERLDWLGDVSARGLEQGAGFMVNYLYDLASVERNHEAFANLAEIVASPALRRLHRRGVADMAAAANKRR